MDCTDCVTEAERVVQLHDEAGFAARQEIRLSAAVITNDRQAARHRLQEHIRPALVARGEHEYIGGGKRDLQLVRGAGTQKVDMAGKDASSAPMLRVCTMSGRI